MEKLVYLPDLVRGEIVSAFGQTVGWQISKYNIPALWVDTEGDGVVIAVLDTGVQLNHPDIGQIIPGYNFNNNTDNINDGDGHGTHCAGIIAARNNTIGIVGVAPKATILVHKVLGDDGTGSLASVIKAIYDAIDKKVDVISMSLGASVGDPELHEAVKKAYAANIPVICAAGNAGNIGELAFPARYPETISIGALNDKNLRAEFSQTGERLDFMAPGVSILSTYPPNRYEYLSGTSMATPWVSGVVALMIAKHRKVGGDTPLTSVEDIREHLRKTAIDLDVAGKDPKTGYGLVDVNAALASIFPAPVEPPAPDPIPEPPTPPPAPVEPPAPSPTLPAPDCKDCEARVGVLESKVTNLENRIDQLNNDVQTHESRIRDLESAVNQLESSYKRVHSKLKIIRDAL